jgi:hypothetical protein
VLTETPKPVPDGTVAVSGLVIADAWSTVSVNVCVAEDTLLVALMQTI